MPGMAVALPIIGVAFSAFCVWLTVRIVNRRERWAKRTAIALALIIVAYPLSSGPVISFWLHGVFSNSTFLTINRLYRPVGLVLCRSQMGMNFGNWYQGLWIDGDELEKRLEALTPRERARLE